MKDDLHTAFRDDVASRGNKVAFVATRPKESNIESFKDLLRGYQDVSPHIDINYFDIKNSFSSMTAVMLFRHGALHIEPEDISEFMEIAKARNLKSLFSDHVDKGGVLVGCGTGAIVLTPDLGVAKIIDAQTELNGDVSGLGHVDFEFIPHYSEIDGKQGIINAYAKETTRRVFACHDGDGVRVTGDHLVLLGDVVEVDG